VPLLNVAELWRNSDPKVWSAALDRYWAFVKPANVTLERALDRLDLERLCGLDAEGWYAFLRDEYFRWKYTAAIGAIVPQSVRRGTAGAAGAWWSGVHDEVEELLGECPHEEPEAERVEAILKMLCVLWGRRIDH
jgi:hypothetical protein